MKILKSLLFCFFVLSLAACSRKESAPVIDFKKQEAQLYSQRGREFRVQFDALYRSDYKQIADIEEHFLNHTIGKTTKFLFGPLTFRSMGGVQKGEKISAHPEKAFIQSGRVLVPYTYEASWMLNEQNSIQKRFELPLPFSASDLGRTNWRSCTEQSDPSHSTFSFLWYFWDPSRLGCQHQLDIDFQNVQIELKEETLQTNETFPEYKKMIHIKNGIPTLEMTFAFGYVAENSDPKPFEDADPGMREFQKFYNEVRATLSSIGFKESPILQNEISSGLKIIGARFTGSQSGVAMTVSVMASAGVDQMDLFANSYAFKHDGFFGWFGHSRVGDGFDADNFKYMLMAHPERFTVTTDYQLVYWAGCNSYSYYTLPFFDLKSKLDAVGDPRGTKHLDIISNTLPSLFAFNAGNASIVFKSILNFQSQPKSYQQMIQKIESLAQRSGYDVIVNVLGDEDNSN